MEPPSQSQQPEHQPAGQFASTQWSLVLAVGDRGGPESDRALQQLCEAYWPPLYAYVRRRVESIHEAQDLTQAFFEKLLEKNYLNEANPERGRFRAFLITAFKHFLSKEWAKAKAAKRGGGRVHFSLDFAAKDSMWGDVSDTHSAERLYERQWAITLLNRVVSRLQREMERNGKGRQFQCLKGFLGGAGDASYATAAAELELSESAARMAASRMRRRYRELLREEIAHTVSGPEEIDDEVKRLFATFSD